MLIKFIKSSLVSALLVYLAMNSHFANANTDSGETLLEKCKVAIKILDNLIIVSRLKTQQTPHIVKAI